MDNLKKAGWFTYKLYVGIGMLAIAIVTVCVVSAVLMRYFLNVSFIFLEEFVTAVFTFSTFWGIGMGVLENEHIVIDVVYLQTATFRGQQGRISRPVRAILSGQF